VPIAVDLSWVTHRARDVLRRITISINRRWMLGDMVIVNGGAPGVDWALSGKP
jgi:hypothetical protein